MSHQDQTFELGLAMAGAISAGAYSAGVFDFLVQALDEWEKERARHAAAGTRPPWPDHRVGIKVMSGASAGSITAAVGAIALAKGVDPIPSEAGSVAHVLPGLYRTWVTMPCMVAAVQGGQDFLALDDLDAGDDGKPVVRSVLNSRLLEEIRDLALTDPPGPRAALRMPYVAENLHVYMTVSNLRGIPYKVAYAGGEYGMQTHGDRMHFALRDLGGWRTRSPWADDDDPSDLSVLALSPEPSPEWRTYGTAALASAAFPVGLAPRELSSASGGYGKRRLPMGWGAEGRLTPAFPEPFAAEGHTFTFLNVDGGLINNEPVEYCRCALLEENADRNPRRGAEADRAVLMIDPFPEPPTFARDGLPPPDVASVLAAMFGALRNQAQFKPSELVLAASETIYSRFMIAPHRHHADSSEERYAMSSGLLGGFGGFLSESFRAHDYQLGRRNCQKFLLDHLSVPGDNPLVRGWAAGNPPDAPSAAPFWTSPPPPTTPGEAGRSPEVRLIPLVGTAAEEVRLPPWPRLTEAELDRVMSRVKARLKAIAPVLVGATTTSNLLRFGIKLVSLYAQKKILNYVRLTILGDLVRRDQIQGWNVERAGIDPDEARRVLAELASPTYDLRTPKSVADATDLAPEAVRGLLQALVGAPGPASVWRGEEDGVEVFTLASRAPSGWTRLPGVRWVTDLGGKPAVG